MKKSEWVIYMWTNLINNKKYIGQTKNIIRRINSHLASRQKKSNSLIFRAFLKYGIENFTFEIIHDEIYSKIEANTLEAKYINDYNTLAKNNHGYNIRGNEKNINEMAESTKVKIGKSNQGKRYSNKKYIGVIFFPQSNSWGAQCSIQGRRRTKVFTTETEAAEAYDKIVLFNYGENAILNFPEKKNAYLSEDLEFFYRFFIFNKYEFMNIYQNPKTKKWKVSVRHRKGLVPRLFLGDYDLPEDAAKMADKIKFYYDLGGWYNFPQDVKKLNKDELKIFFDSISPPKTSSYPGVVKIKNCISWAAIYHLNRKKIHIGSFPTELQAFQAREAFIKTLQVSSQDSISSTP